MWSALFNLENSFGTHEGLMRVCKEAAAVNDSKTVFLRLAAVLDKSKKHQVNRYLLIVVFNHWSCFRC